jgi:epoxide hydrolase
VHYEDSHQPPDPAPGPTTIPIGLAAAEDGDFRSVRRFAERDHAQIVSWTTLPGVVGHYSAHTHPDQLAADIRGFFRPLRSATDKEN